MSLIKNASPDVIMLGADDKSTRVITPSRDPLPYHMPLCMFFGSKGTTERAVMGAGKFAHMYGSATFDVNGPYFNHATRFMQSIGGTGNTCMTKRIVPSDAGVRSNVAIYVDIMQYDVPNYLRNSDGSYVIDPDTNEPEVDSDNETISGNFIKIIKEYSPTEIDLGSLTSKKGSMEVKDDDGNVVAESTMYPIAQIPAKYQGLYYNNIGFSIKSYLNDDADQTIMAETKALSYGFTLYTRADANSKGEILRTLMGDPTLNVSFKEGAINPLTGKRMDIDKVFPAQWFNTTDELLPLRYDDYDKPYFYYDNIKKVSDAVMEYEKDHVTTDVTTWNDGLDSDTLSWFDYSGADDETLTAETLLINLLTGKSTKSVNFFTLVYSDEAPLYLTEYQREISLSSNTPVYLEGGSDGTLSNEEFEKAVVSEMAKYADSESEYQDLAINVESFFYDSGFTLATKKELVNFIALRKDTVLIMSTHDDSLGDKYLNLTDSAAVGVAIKTRMDLAPESEYFGTSVARACIVVGTGVMRDGSAEQRRIPLTYEIGMKMAKLAGAGDGKWNLDYLFDTGATAKLEYLVDVQPAFIPSGAKATIWNDGLVWAQPLDRGGYTFPAVQTVYTNDTSVLNTIFTVTALSAITKIGAYVWRNFTGSVKYTNSEFVVAVKNFTNKQLKDLFGGVIVVVPDVQITEEDELRGYSWRLVNKLYANNAKTKMVYASEIYRMSDLNA